MPTLLYIHGFLSSPKSLKAVQTGEWLRLHRPRVRYLCPFLTAYPDETRATLEAQVEQNLPDGPVWLLGSSLGGFWATWLSEKYDLRAALINPLVDLSLFGAAYLGKPLKNYHTDDTYLLTGEHVSHFRQAEVSRISKPENYLLLVQTGDEVLDYHLAVKKYAGSRQIIEEGGDHTFRHFDTRIGEVMAFFEGNA